MNVVDESYEWIDPTPDIWSLFQEFDRLFFENALRGCEVKWSPRMTLCAGLCSYQPQSGFCSIRLSEPLLQLRPRRDLVNTLLHEMIHAYLFLTSPIRDHDDHGPLFQSHMRRINAMANANITIYHTFHDEVDSYRVHWWKCNGVCQAWKPYYGIVKRAMNRAPGPNDTWWRDHQRKCGGTYTKIKEPEGFQQKRSKRKQNTTSQGKKAARIDTYFNKASSSTVQVIDLCSEEEEGC